MYASTHRCSYETTSFDKKNNPLLYWNTVKLCDIICIPYFVLKHYFPNIKVFVIIFKMVLYFDSATEMKRLYQNNIQPQIIIHFFLGAERSLCFFHFKLYFLNSIFLHSSYNLHCLQVENKVVQGK